MAKKGGKKEVIVSPDGRNPDTKRWLPGTSGNPKGRPKGAKGRIRELKDEMELALREGFSPDIVKAVADSLVAEAMNGNVTAAKYILDKFISNQASSEDTGDQVKAEYTFKVLPLTQDDLPKEVQGEIINQEENHGEQE